MTLMLTAVVIGVVLVGTLLLVLRPLYLARNTDEVGASLWILMLGFPLAVIVIYAQVTTYPWDRPELTQPQATAAGDAAAEEDPANAAIEQMVAGLAARLEAEPDDLTGWEMLGRSYIQLGRYDAAADAWREAWRISEGERPDIAVNFAEALALADPQTLSGLTGELLDAVLEDEPRNAKALWYGGMAAVARGQLELAEQRWALLLDDPNLPPNFRQVVQQQLAAMGAEVPETSAPGGTPPMYRISIDVAPELADRVKPGQALFVFARDAGGDSPPVAVKRLTVDQLPINTTLRDSDVMMPGLKLTGMDNLRIVARVSASGGAMEASGDVYGEVFPEPLGDSVQKIELTINQVVP